jgi:2-polyprenyl-6-methoxyphenol hydroxylase-like FAD-dependent oxidoreductase
MNDPEVLVVGAGPVGLTIALDLARRGIRTLLVEKRERPVRLPKMERSNPRTMEIYRRLGMVERIRAAAYPPNEPMDVLVLRSMMAPPLVHQVYPTVSQARAQIAACADGTLPREPYQLVSQYTLEDLLMQELLTLGGVEVRLGTALVNLSQDDAGVQVEIHSSVSGTTSTVQARYLVACDGAGSPVRQKLGIGLEGQTNLGTVTNVFFRCDDLLQKSQVPRARHYLFAGIDAVGGAAGTIVVQDDCRHFGSHLPILPSPEIDFAAELRRLTSLDISPEILFVGRWTQNMQVAEEHGHGRVFLAGDANHIYIPAGGLGMNTGIGDTANLGWKLEAVLRGWGGPQLLGSYFSERGAAARRNIKAVAYAIEGVVKWRKIPPPAPLRDPAANEAARRAYAAEVESLNRRVYEMHGTELGYRYESSIVVSDHGEPPPDESYTYRPTTWPGAHLPHVWLRPGVALYDVMKPGYTLLRLGGSCTDIRAIEAAFARRGVPYRSIDIPDTDIREVMQRDLVLVRPDLHVAWRGDTAPADADAMTAIVTGHAGHP